MTGGMGSGPWHGGVRAIRPVERRLSRHELHLREARRGTHQQTAVALAQVQVEERGEVGRWMRTSRVCFERLLPLRVDVPIADLRAVLPPGGVYQCQ
jgi:hypothetical protein